MGNRIVVTDQNIIGIRDFMEKFLEVPYEGDKKLTHYEMDKYLMEKEKKLPIRVNLNYVNRELLNDGTYLVVREETKRMKKGRKLFYENPKRFSADTVLEELKASTNPNKLKNDRARILRESGLMEGAFGEVIEIPKQEEVYSLNNSVNRQKAYVLTSGNRVKRRCKY